MINNNKTSSIFFIKNSVENLKIRVTIEKLGTILSGIYLSNNDSKPMTSGTTSSRTQTSIGSGFEDYTSNYHYNSGNGQGTSQIIERTSFYWGELLENNFRNEESFNISNDKSLNDNDEYDNNNIIQRNRIFSIIVNNETSSTSLSSIEENEFKEKTFLIRNAKIKPINLITKKSKIIDIPTDKQKFEGRHVNGTKEEMIIKVYLGTNDKYGNNYDETQEFTVANLLLINKKMLIINNIIINEGMKIQGKDGFYKIFFEIIDTVVLSKLSHDNESFTLFLSDDDNDEKLYNEIDKKFFANICYLLTIQKTELFPYNGVYVEYVIELPENMSLTTKDNSILMGRTHVSRNNYNGESYFSFPIELNCLLQLTEKFSSFPMIYFRICSEDEYNSFHINGYTSISLPFQSGHYNHILTSWCPIEKDSNYSQFYNLFLGESTDIKDVTKQFIRNKTCSSTIGIQTESRGNLHLTVSTIIQSKHLILNDEISSLKYSVINKGYHTNLSLYMKIKKVLIDFEKARNSLLLLKNKQI
ncbi:26S proteasome non-ATPase regulatory subunit 14 [Strongyloides ratti]|uniref:26S proteasome non-ATPase regulatory subunit 14 n=1 Tax=Strongyloides ratti TaxID=34506 RepID=A0A090LIP6_STRRB|nr:26S proteasome non-ATPase regulatory subunit 14 [Strongyloides ratti]CEF68003.1 26S proteasome non-ATPase regulatory subunit 14 [Strongyloides ratti]